MVSLTQLWLPILLSAVAVFVASSVIHMVLPWHTSDYPRVPNEDALMDAVRPLAIPPGEYIIRIEVNPGYVPSRKNPCRFLDPATGLCHALQESDYSNNLGEALVTITDHPGKQGWGPGGGQDPLDEMIDDENRPDK